MKFVHVLTLEQFKGFSAEEIVVLTEGLKAKMKTFDTESTSGISNAPHQAIPEYRISKKSGMKAGRKNSKHKIGLRVRLVRGTKPIGVDDRECKPLIVKNGKAVYVSGVMVKWV